MHKHDIVCLSTQDFDDLWTRKQRWMTRLAERHRVLYVEMQMHWITYLRELPACWKRPARSRHGPVERAPNLWVWTPPVCQPLFQMLPAISRYNNRRLWSHLRTHLDGLGFRDMLLWLYTPYSSDVIDAVKPTHTVYECVDDFSAAKGLIRPAVVRKMEDRTLEQSDLTIVTSTTLRQIAQRRAATVRLSHNACDTSFFARAAEEAEPIHDELRGMPGPIAGFVGAVTYWVDLDLLAKLARARPDLSIVLVGPVRVNTRACRDIPNIHFLGRRPYESLPAYLRGFDVCLNPYRRDDVAAGASPLKLYEYLATGKPIVSTDMPEARKFEEVVRVAADDDAFMAHVEAALTETDADRERRAERQCELARDNSWDSRFNEVEGWVAEMCASSGEPESASRRSDP